MQLQLLFLFVALYHCTGCGSSAPLNRSHADPNAGVAIADLNNVTRGVLTPTCPNSVTAAGAACTTSGLICQYNADPRLNCRPQLACDGNSWRATDPNCGALALRQSCPTTLAIARDAANCDPNSSGACVYDGALCTCQQLDCGGGIPLPDCTPSTPYKWGCLASSAAGCPTAAPPWGAICSAAGLNCLYEIDCLSSYAAACTNGIWQPGQLDTCPIQ